MKYKISEILSNKKEYLELLLIGDEEEKMIDLYLEKGRMFILRDSGVKCAAVVTELNSNECELKNIAIYPKDQRKGYGKYMLDYLVNMFLKKYKTMYVGTGDTPITEFYKKCGFKFSHVLNNFFIDNYKEPIIEDGIQLVDMIYLKINREK